MSAPVVNRGGVFSWKEGGEPAQQGVPVSGSYMMLGNFRNKSNNGNINLGRALTLSQLQLICLLVQEFGRGGSSR